MGGCFSCSSPSTELTQAVRGLDQPHLLLSSGKDGAAFHINYYYDGETQPHPGTLTLTILNDGRTVTGSGQDDIDRFTIEGRLVVLAPNDIRLYFTKRYTGLSTSTIQYAGQCTDMGHSCTFVGEWTIGGGWLGSGNWNMRPFQRTSQQSMGWPSPALNLTDISTQVAAGQYAAPTYRLDITG